MQEIEVLIEDLYRDVITRVGAVKTGAMRDSIQANVTKIGGEYTFEVTAIHYFGYVDDMYEITRKVVNDPGFERIKDELAQLMINDFLKEI